MTTDKSTLTRADRDAARDAEHRAITKLYDDNARDNLARAVAQQQALCDTFDARLRKMRDVEKAKARQLELPEVDAATRGVIEDRLVILAESGDGVQRQADAARAVLAAKLQALHDFDCEHGNPV